MEVSTGIKTDSVIMAIDPAAGKTLWRTIQATEAIQEAKDSYTTPLPYNYGKNKGIIIAGADTIICYNPATGKEIWRYYFTEERINNWRLVASPVIAGDLICFPLPRGDTIRAIRPNNNDFNKIPEMVWEYNGPIPDVCTPAYYNGLIYVLGGKKKCLTCFEPKSGKVIWQKHIESSGNFFASPTAADGKIYLISLHGEVVVFAAGRRPKILSDFSIGKEK